MFLKISKFMYKGQSLKSDTKAKMNFIEVFQYFCEKTILKTYGPIRFSYGIDRAGKTAYDTSEKMFKNMHIVSNRMVHDHIEYLMICYCMKNLS